MKSRAGRTTRRRGRAAAWSLVRSNAIALCGVALAMLAPLCLLGLLGGWTFAVGFAVGVALTFLVLVVLYLSGALAFIVGASSERDTSRSLRRHLPQGWRLVDDVPFDRFNVDHVLLGPGRVIAIETKFTTNRVWTEWGRPTKQLQASIAQARHAARKIGLLLKIGDVEAAVITWGPTTRSDKTRDHDGVPVIPGDRIADWLAGLASGGSPEPDPATTERVLVDYLRSSTIA